MQLQYELFKKYLLCKLVIFLLLTSSDLIHPTLNFHILDSWFAIESFLSKGILRFTVTFLFITCKSYFKMTCLELVLLHFISPWVEIKEESFCFICNPVYDVAIFASFDFIWWGMEFVVYSLNNATETK